MDKLHGKFEGGKYFNFDAHPDANPLTFIKIYLLAK